jgi:hypothetical protein
MLDMRWIEDRLRRGGTLNGLSVPEEQLFRAHASERGLSAEVLLRRWAAAGPVTSQASKEKDNSRNTRIVSVETDLLRNLDFWPLADDQRDDEDDGDDEDDRVCGACHGSGRDAAGNVCKACRGTGIPAPGDEEDEDKDDEFEDEE